jgi:hypothetical protein
VRFVVRDDLRRSRLTVAFRGILAIPHLIWFSLWGTAMALLLPIQWIVTLVTGRAIEELHQAYEIFLRYGLHLYAYLFLAADPYPGFLGQPGRYPIDLARIPHRRQRRWTVALRLLLVLPPYLLVAALGSGFIASAGLSPAIGIGPALAVVFFAWFAVLIKGRMPAGFRDFTVYSAAYATQVLGYLLLLTDRFPDSDPKTVPLLPRPRHTVRMEDEDEPRRHRLIVLLRLALLAPHTIWLTLWWALAVLVVAPVTWLIAIATGRVPARLHGFQAAFVRYQAHVIAFGTLAAGLFPGFDGRPGVYPIDIAIDGPRRQSRWSIAGRWLLAFPAWAVAATFATVWLIAPVGAWVAALVTGRVPRGLQALLAYTVRYNAQVQAYGLLLTDRYPHTGPSEREGEPVFALPPGLKPFALAPEAPLHAPSAPAPEPVSAAAIAAGAGGARL